MEHTFILIKPDAFKRRLIGEVITRFERKGFYLSSMKTLLPTAELLDKHYEEHVSKGWYPEMRKFFMSGKVVAMVWSGKNIVKEARKMIGETDPLKALMGTIRGDFGVETGRNLVHGSDSVSAAEREIKIWFNEGFEYVQAIDHALLYEN